MAYLNLWISRHLTNLIFRKHEKTNSLFPFLIYSYFMPDERQACMLMNAYKLTSDILITIIIL